MVRRGCASQSLWPAHPTIGLGRRPGPPRSPAPRAHVYSSGRDGRKKLVSGSKSKFPGGAAACVAIVLTLLAGCGRDGDTLEQAAKSDAAGGAAAPTVAEVRSIAKEGFVYGLSIVMNYAVMYDYIIDRDSGQWKAPFNEINNEHRVFTYQDTTIVTPNSDTPYSLLWMDLRVEPMVVSVPEVDPKRYYAVMLVDGNTFNYGYIGSRATGNGPGDYLVAGPRWQGETPPGIKDVFRSTTDFSMAVFRT